MIPQHAGAGKVTGDGNALGGKSAVTDHIAEQVKLGTTERTGILQHRLQRVLVSMDITENRVAHQDRGDGIAVAVGTRFSRGIPSLDSMSRSRSRTEGVLIMPP